MVGNVTLFTCPAGVTTIIKQLATYNAAAVTSLISYGINNAISTGRQYSKSMATLTSDLIECWLVLEPGDTFTLTVHSGATITSTGHGTLLQGVAP